MIANKITVAEAKERLDALSRLNLDDNDYIDVPDILKNPIETGKKKLIKYGSVMVGGALAYVGFENAVLTDLAVSSVVELGTAVALSGIPVIMSFAREKLLKKYVLGLF